MKKILIVDDEPNIVMSLEYIFKKEDFQVYIARDGEEAIEIVENTIPDIILLDIMMPNVDGYQVLNYLKSSETLNKIKVILYIFKPLFYFFLSPFNCFLKTFKNLNRLIVQSFN